MNYQTWIVDLEILLDRPTLHHASTTFFPALNEVSHTLTVLSSGGFDIATD